MNNAKYVAPPLCTDHTLSILALDTPGILSKISGLITRRGFNIETVCVAKSHQKDMALITIVVNVDKKNLDQIKKQLHKVIDIYKISSIDPLNKIERELALIRVRSIEKYNSELYKMIEIFNGKIIDATPNEFAIEITGIGERVDSFINMIHKQILIDVTRTGKITIKK